MHFTLSNNVIFDDKNNKIFKRNDGEERYTDNKILNSQNVHIWDKK